MRWNTMELFTEQTMKDYVQYLDNENFKVDLKITDDEIYLFSENTSYIHIFKEKVITKEDFTNKFKLIQKLAKEKNIKIKNLTKCKNNLDSLYYEYLEQVFEKNYLFKKIEIHTQELFKRGLKIGCRDDLYYNFIVYEYYFAHQEYTNRTLAIEKVKNIWYRLNEIEKELKYLQENQNSTFYL